MQHLTTQLAEQLLAPGSLLQERQDLLRHLTQTCDRCRSTLDQLLSGDSRRGESYESIIDSSLAPAQEFISGANRQRKQAASDFAELLELSPGARKTRIDRAIKRFRNPFLVDLLISESRNRLVTQPTEALEFAECALQVSLRLPHSVVGDSWAMTCVARSHAYRGNALRVLGELRAAEPPLETAISLFRERGDADPLIEAELLSLKASLQKDRLHLDAARESLRKALDLYRTFGLPNRIARTLMKLAMVLADGDELPEAIVTIQEALNLFDPENDTYLYLGAQHNLAYYLEAAGRIDEAEALLTANLDRYRTFSETAMALRFGWSVGTIARSLGRLDQARQTLEEVKAGFSHLQQAYDAALVGLDLALVYVEQGDTEALIPLAAEIVPVFEAQERGRDTLAALILFREAARRQEVTTQLVSQLVSYLGRSPLVS